MSVLENCDDRVVGNILHMLTVLHGEEMGPAEADEVCRVLQDYVTACLTEDELAKRGPRTPEGNVWLDAELTTEDESLLQALKSKRKALIESGYIGNDDKLTAKGLYFWWWLLEQQNRPVK